MSMMHIFRGRITLGRVSHYIVVLIIALTQSSSSGLSSSKRGRLLSPRTRSPYFDDNKPTMALRHINVNLSVSGIKVQKEEINSKRSDKVI